MAKKLTFAELLTEGYSQLLLTEAPSQASIDAKALGLEYAGWGKWRDPKTKKVVAKTVKGQLVKLSPDDPEAQEDPQQSKNFEGELAMKKVLTHMEDYFGIDPYDDEMADLIQPLVIKTAKDGAVPDDEPGWVKLPQNIKQYLFFVAGQANSPLFKAVATLDVPVPEEEPPKPLNPKSEPAAEVGFDKAIETTLANSGFSSPLALELIKNAIETAIDADEHGNDPWEAAENALAATWKGPKGQMWTKAVQSVSKFISTHLDKAQAKEPTIDDGEPLIALSGDVPADFFTTDEYKNLALALGDLMAKVPYELRKPTLIAAANALFSKTSNYDTDLLAALEGMGVDIKVADQMLDVVADFRSEKANQAAANHDVHYAGDDEPDPNDDPDEPWRDVPDDVQDYSNGQIHTPATLAALNKIPNKYHEFYYDALEKINGEFGVPNLIQGAEKLNKWNQFIIDSVSNGTVFDDVNDMLNFVAPGQFDEHDVVQISNVLNMQAMYLKGKQKGDSGKLDYDGMVAKSGVDEPYPFQQKGTAAIDKLGNNPTAFDPDVALDKMGLGDEYDTPKVQKIKQFLDAMVQETDPYKIYYAGTKMKKAGLITAAEWKPLLKYIKATKELEANKYYQAKKGGDGQVNPDTQTPVEVPAPTKPTFDPAAVGAKMAKGLMQAVGGHGWTEDAAKVLGKMLTGVASKEPKTEEELMAALHQYMPGWLGGSKKQTLVDYASEFFGIPLDNVDSLVQGQGKSWALQSYIKNAAKTLGPTFQGLKPDEKVAVVDALSLAWNAATPADAYAQLFDLYNGGIIDSQQAKALEKMLFSSEKWKDKIAKSKAAPATHPDTDEPLPTSPLEKAQHIMDDDSKNIAMHIGKYVGDLSMDQLTDLAKKTIASIATGYKEPAQVYQQAHDVLDSSNELSSFEKEDLAQTLISMAMDAAKKINSDAKFAAPIDEPTPPIADGPTPPPPAPPPTPEVPAVAAEFGAVPANMAGTAFKDLQEKGQTLALSAIGKCLSDHLHGVKKLTPQMTKVMGDVVAKMMKGEMGQNAAWAELTDAGLDNDMANALTLNAADAKQKYEASQVQAQGTAEPEVEIPLAQQKAVKTLMFKMKDDVDKVMEWAHKKWALETDPAEKQKFMNMMLAAAKYHGGLLPADAVPTPKPPVTSTPDVPTTTQKEPTINAGNGGSFSEPKVEAAFADFKSKYPNAPPVVMNKLEAAMLADIKKGDLTYAGFKSYAKSVGVKPVHIADLMGAVDAAYNDSIGTPSESPKGQDAALSWLHKKYDTQLTPTAWAKVKDFIAMDEQNGDADYDQTQTYLDLHNINHGDIDKFVSALKGKNAPEQSAIDYLDSLNIGAALQNVWKEHVAEILAGEQPISMISNSQALSKTQKETLITLVSAELAKQQSAATDNLTPDELIDMWDDMPPTTKQAWKYAVKNIKSGFANIAAIDNAGTLTPAQKFLLKKLVEKEMAQDAAPSPSAPATGVPSSEKPTAKPPAPNEPDVVKTTADEAESFVQGYMAGLGLNFNQLPSAQQKELTLATKQAINSQSEVGVEMAFQTLQAHSHIKGMSPDAYNGLKMDILAKLESEGMLDTSPDAFKKHFDYEGQLEKFLASHPTIASNLTPEQQKYMLDVMKQGLAMTDDPRAVKGDPGTGYNKSKAFYQQKLVGVIPGFDEAAAKAWRNELMAYHDSLKKSQGLFAQKKAEVEQKKKEAAELQKALASITSGDTAVQLNGIVSALGLDAMDNLQKQKLQVGIAKALQQPTSQEMLDVINDMIGLDSYAGYHYGTPSGTVPGIKGPKAELLKQLTAAAYFDHKKKQATTSKVPAKPPVEPKVNDPITSRMQAVFDNWLDKTGISIGHVPRHNGERKALVNAVQQGISEPDPNKVDQIVNSLLATATSLTDDQIASLRDLVHQERQKPASQFGKAKVYEPKPHTAAAGTIAPVAKTPVVSKSGPAMDLLNDPDWKAKEAYYKVSPLIKNQVHDIALKGLATQPAYASQPQVAMSLKNQLVKTGMDGDAAKNLANYLAREIKKGGPLAQKAKQVWATKMGSAAPVQPAVTMDLTNTKDQAKAKAQVASLPNHVDKHGFIKNEMVPGEKIKIANNLQWDTPGHSHVPSADSDAKQQHAWRVKNLPKKLYDAFTVAANSWQGSSQWSKSAATRKAVNEAMARAIEGPPPQFAKVDQFVERGMTIPAEDFKDWIRAFEVGKKCYIGPSGFSANRSTASAFGGHGAGAPGGDYVQIMLRVRPNDKGVMKAARLNQRADHNSHPSEQEIVVGTNRDTRCTNVIKHVIKSTHGTGFAVAYEIELQYDDSMNEGFDAVGLNGNLWHGLSRETIKALIKYNNTSLAGRYKAPQ